MREPWQAPGADGGAQHLAPRFVCRVSGAPADTVDSLRPARTLELLGTLQGVEDRLAGAREALSALLFAAIGRAADDKPQRNRLITLKRELYNLRPVSPAKLEEAAAGLPPEEAGTVRRFQAELDERRRLEEELRAALGPETAALRERFRTLIRDPDFRKGLMVSSRSLYQYVDRYRAAAELSGKEEKTERGLLRYYTRMAMKATPFSTFCAIIDGRFVDGDGADGSGLFRFAGDPRAKRSFVRINKLLYGILLDHLKERPAFRHALNVEPNPTMRLEAGRLVFLTALQGREVFQRMPPNEVLDLIAQRFRKHGTGKAPLGELILALSQDPQIEASPEEAEAYLDKLLEIGFLRFHTGIREQDADWDLPFRALLDAVDDDHARQSSELLVQVRAQTEAYTTADVEGRSRIIDEIHALVNAAFEAMEVKGRLRRDMPFYEDATAGASAEIPLTPAVARTFDLFAEWTRLTARLAWPRGEQATMRHFFDSYYTDARSVPLLKFYEDFYREHFKGHVEKEAKLRAGIDREQLKDYNVGNPFDLEFIKAMNAARTRLTEAVQARWREHPEAEEVSIAAAEVEQALRGVENTSGVCRSMGSFGLLLPPDGEHPEPRLLLQGGSYTAGYGKYFSRFLYMLPEEMPEQVRRDNAALTGELLAEICGDAQFNANLHPPLLRWEISYPTGEGGASEEQLLSSTLVVEPDPEDPHTLLLRHGPSGKRVIPVDLGFLNPRMRPPLYQLLSRFTPPVTFAPVLPETPEPPRLRPAPAPAAEEGEGAPVAEAAEAPAEAPPEPPAPRIAVRPRMTYEGRLVLSRRRWTVPGALFPQRAHDESAAD
ncbi:MAG TPA: lantibiotic dehydratase, partial [Longimicrobiaceae bacterium]|nr:lantibiotic dehydratase [Longimicrobiaceae bacterium]